MLAHILGKLGQRS